jgi:hypothetical protein
MADIFISYARENKDTARRLADALEAFGWSAWWDAEIPPGETWDEMIERELTAARVAVVLWSAASVKKRWVKTEASLALDIGKLVPALIESVQPPIAFRPIQAAMLVGWQGETDHEGFRQLVGSIERLAGPPPSASTAPGLTHAGLADAGASVRSLHPPAVGSPPARRPRLPLLLGGAVAMAGIAAAVWLILAPSSDPAPARPTAGVPTPAAPIPPPAAAPAANASAANAPAANAPAANAPAAPAPGGLPGRYPEASTRPLTDAELAGLDAAALRLMRNEIYARHGYLFQDPDLRRYFSAQPWYRPIGSEVTLSSVEQANVARIRRYEAREAR